MCKFCIDSISDHGAIVCGRRDFLKAMAAVSAATMAATASALGTGSNAAGKYTVAVYYMPYWDTKAQWKGLESVRPRYKGQYQPEVPLWGPLVNSPATMEKYVHAMTTHGINTIIFDWFRFQTTRKLEGPLTSFLKDASRHQIKFALMWANPPGFGHRAAVGQRRFDQIADDAIAYFKHPNYWTIDGKPYFSIYWLSTLLREFGGVVKTRAALDGFRRRARKAGLPGLHLNLVTTSYIDEEAKIMLLTQGQSMPDNPAKKIQTLGELVAALGFDSTTWYTWMHWVTAMGEYKPWGNAAIALWKKQPLPGIPFFPNVTMGWDGMPQGEGGLIVNNTPREFEGFLLKTRHWLDAHPASKNILTINAWNEWGEGSYLEPDVVHRMAYLDAVRKVFPPHK